ncbi:MAG: stage II sporulation protein M [Candidatus Nanohalobium sp.]
MLPELILREEHTDNYPLLFLLGLAASVAGFFAATTLFPRQSAVLSVVFASLPLVYPLTTKFLEDEDGDDQSYVEEVSLYAALFAGQVFGFTMLSMANPEVFALQAEVAGFSGNAVVSGLFTQVLFNNLIVFTGILAVSAIFGSAGSFILVWNASVMGKFFAELMMKFQGLKKSTPLLYFPHAAFEMTGFIIAGVSGSLISAAVYREHFDRDTWRNLVILVLAGVGCIFVGASLETGII